MPEHNMNQPRGQAGPMPRSTTQLDRLRSVDSSAFSDKDVFSGMLQSIARNELLKLGAADESPIHHALLAVAWEAFQLGLSVQSGEYQQAKESQPQPVK